MVPSEVDLDRGLALLALPRELGAHPEDGEMITAGIGRFGPYLKHGPVYKSLAKDDDVLSHRPEPRRLLAGRAQGRQPPRRCAGQAAGQPSRPMASRSPCMKAATAPM